MPRLTSNRAILEVISQYVEENPDLRFHQILQNLDINVACNSGGNLQDLWYEESDKTLARAYDAYEKASYHMQMEKQFKDAHDALENFYKNYKNI